MNEDEIESIPKDETIAVEDSTPPIREQAQASGWQCEYYKFGLAENKGVEWFNPSMVQRPDGLFLLARGSEPHPQGFTFGQNDIWSFAMDKDKVTPTFGRRLKWQNKEPSQHFEDARGIYYPGINQTIISACTFCWYQFKRWTGAHQVVGFFDETWDCQKMVYPKIGGNPGEMCSIDKPENFEKNWLFFVHEGELQLLYKSRPWLVCSFRNNWGEWHEWKDEVGANWAYGDLRGGTPPVRVGDYYFTFPHSSLPWKGRYRRYYAGCLAFEAKPPFKPKFVTPEPLLIGSQNDYWTQKKPLVVFPCGSLYENGEWLISMGVNDLKAAWLKCSHESLLERMKPVAEGIQIFMASGLSEGEQSKNGGDADAVRPRTKDTGHKLNVKPRQRSTRKVRRKYKMSPEGLANLRANAAKAREARIQKKLQGV